MSTYYRILLFYPLILFGILIVPWFFYHWEIAFDILMDTSTVDYTVFVKQRKAPHLVFVIPLVNVTSYYLHSFLIPLFIFHIFQYYRWKNAMEWARLRFYVVSVVLVAMVASFKIVLQGELTLFEHLLAISITPFAAGFVQIPAFLAFATFFFFYHRKIRKSIIV